MAGPAKKAPAKKKAPTRRPAAAKKQAAPTKRAAAATAGSRPAPQGLPENPPSWVETAGLALVDELRAALTAAGDIVASNAERAVARETETMKVLRSHAVRSAEGADAKDLDGLAEAAKARRTAIAKDRKAREALIATLDADLTELTTAFGLDAS